MASAVKNFSGDDPVGDVSLDVRGPSDREDRSRVLAGRYSHSIGSLFVRISAERRHIVRAPVVQSRLTGSKKEGARAGWRRRPLRAASLIGASGRRRLLAASNHGSPPFTGTCQCPQHGVFFIYYARKTDDVGSAAYHYRGPATPPPMPPEIAQRPVSRHRGEPFSDIFSSRILRWRRRRRSRK